MLYYKGYNFLPSFRPIVATARRTNIIWKCYTKDLKVFSKWTNRTTTTTKAKQDTRHILIMTDVKWHQKLIVGRDNLCVEDDQPVNHIASPENHVWGYRENDNILGYPSFICRPLFGFFHIWSQKTIQVVLDFRKHLDHHYWFNKLS